MLILAFDTATSRLLVVLGRGEEILCSKSILSPQAHLENLLPAIDSLLQETSFSLSQIEAVAVGVGPGSFTGLRIGVSTARALAQALKIPLIEVPTLDTLAYNLFSSEEISSQKTLVAPLIEAKRGEIYFCLYEVAPAYAKASAGRPAFKRISEYLVKSPPHLLEVLKSYGPNILLTGEALETYGPFFKKNTSYSQTPPSFWFPQGSSLLALATKEKRKGKDFYKVSPIYLRPPVFKKPGEKWS